MGFFFRLYKIPLICIALVIVTDQLSKIYVKTSMYLGQEYHVIGDWFKIHFVENEGMAFGMAFGGEYGKLILTLFRLIAVFFIFYYVHTLIVAKSPKGLIWSISLIIAGALGNIIDSVFYGLIFSDSLYKIATLFPEGGGYAPIFHGKVVDMLYFPIFKGFLPDWVPFWGGKYAIFFRPVFNIADVAITVGVFAILIFQKQFFKDGDLTEPLTAANSTDVEVIPLQEKPSTNQSLHSENQESTDHSDVK